MGSYEQHCHAVGVPSSERWGRDDLYLPGDVATSVDYHARIVFLESSIHEKLRGGERLVVLSMLSFISGEFANVKYLVLHRSGRVGFVWSIDLVHDPRTMFDHAWGRGNWTR